MTEDFHDWLRRAPFTLALSGGYFGFFAHCGVLQALEEKGLRPNKITGASAGALVGAASASGLSAGEIRELLYAVKARDFCDPRPGLGVLRGEKFHRLLKRHFVATFAQTLVPLEVAVFDLFARRTRFVTQGALPKAVVASCAVPLMFHPVFLDGRVLLDGGLFDKSAIPNADSRVLSIFLESRGWMGVYERKVSFAALKPGHKVLRFQALPAVNVNSLDVGPSAYQAAFERTRRALSSSCQGNLHAV